MVAETRMRMIKVAAAGITSASVVTRLLDGMVIGVGVGVGVEVEFDIKLHLLDLTLASCAGADVNELVNGGTVRAEVRQSREA